MIRQLITLGLGPNRWIVWSFMASLALIIAVSVTFDTVHADGSIIAERDGKVLTADNSIRLAASGPYSETAFTIHISEPPQGETLYVTLWDINRKLEFFTSIPDVPSEWFNSKYMNFTQDDWQTKKEVRVRSADSGETYIYISAFLAENFTNQSFTPLPVRVLEPDEPFSPQISIEDASATEGTAIDFKVKVNPPSAQQITLDYATADGTADSNDYSSTSAGSLIIPAGSDSATISVQTTDDTTFEKEETFTVTLSGAPTGTDIKTATATGVIENDDPRPISQIRVADTSADEGSSIDFEVSVSPPWHQPMTLSYTITDVTTSTSTKLSGARSGLSDIWFGGKSETSTDDFLDGARSGSISLAADESSATLSIPTRNDVREEADETFTVTLSGASEGTNLQRATATGVIKNNDIATAISIADASTVEGGVMRFPVTLEPPAIGRIDIHYRTFQDTATVGADYASRQEERDADSAVINVEPGENKYFLHVDTKDDTLTEGTESFSIEILVAKNVWHGILKVTESRATGKIEDDDLMSVTPSTLHIGEGAKSSASYDVALLLQPSEETTMSIDVSPKGKLNIDKTELTFSTSTWNQPQTVTVTGVSDAAFDSHDVTLSHTVQINSDIDGDADALVRVHDPERVNGRFLDVANPLSPQFSVNEEQSFAYTFRLDDRPPFTMNIRPQIASGDDVLTFAPEVLTFTPQNYSQGQKVTVTAIADRDLDDHRVQINHVVDELPNAEVSGKATTQVVDNKVNPPQPSVIVSKESMTIVEGGSGGSYTVKLETDPGATSTVTVSIASDNTKVAVSTSTLTFTGGDSGDWSTAQTVQVTSSEDNDSDHERATISHTVTGYPGVTTAPSIKVSVNDDEADEDIILTPSSFSIYEGGDKTTVNVRLTTDPGKDIDMAITPYRTEGLRLSAHDFKLTGGPDGNWEDGYDLIVGTADNDDGDTLHKKVQLTVHAPGYPPHEQQYARKNLDFWMLDDDISAGLMISDDPFIVHEGGQERSYEVSLNTDPGQKVTVSISNPDSSKLTISTSTLIFDTGNWYEPQRVTVSASEDDDEDHEDLSITHTVTGYTGVTSVSKSVTVYDDDAVPGVIVSPTNVAITEGDAAGSFDVSLTTDPGKQVTIKIVNPDAGAVQVSPSTLTFTNGPNGDWRAPQTVTVTPLDDNDAQYERPDLSLEVSGYDSVSTAPAARIVVTDDEAPSTLPVVEVSTSTLNLTEGGGAGSYTIQLKSDPGQPVTINVVNPDAGAVSVSTTSVDFDSATWNSPRTITVTPVDDENAYDESVEIEHRTYNKTAGSVTITVEDDGEPGVIISPSRLYIDEIRGVNLLAPEYEGRSLDYIVGRSPMSARLCLKLAADPEDTVRIHLPKNKGFGYWIPSGPTTSWGAYEHTIEFTGGSDGNWNQDNCTGVWAHRDPIKKDKSGTVTLNVTGYKGVSSVPLDWEIYDNAWARIEPSKTTINLKEGGDSTTYILRVNYRPDEVVTITVNNPDTSSIQVSPTKVTLATSLSPYSRNCRGANYCVPITVTPLSDSDFSDETITLTHSVKGFFHVTSAPDVVINLKEPFKPSVIVSKESMTIGEGGSGKSYTVKLETDPGDTSTVTVGIASDNQKVVVSASTLTFTGGASGTWSTAQTVQVTSPEDNDSDYERATISHTVTGYPRVSTAPSIRVGVNDNEVAEDMIITPSSFSIYEGGNTTTVNVRLTTDPAQMVKVTIKPHTIGGASLSALKFTLTGGPDGNWEDGYDLVFTTDDDDGDTLDNKVRIEIYGWGYPPHGQEDIRRFFNVRMVDDDRTAGLAISDDPFVVHEGGQERSYDVLLNTDPGQEVTVSIANPDSSKLAISTSTLIFDTGNWYEPQRVTVSALEDDDNDHEDLSITHTVTGYTGVTSVSKNVSVYDDDVAPAVIVSPTNVAITEGDVAGSFDVSLTTDPGKQVTIRIVNPDTGAVQVSPSTLTFTHGPNGDWRESQTVAVTPLDDNDAQYERVELSLEVSGYDGVATAPSAHIVVTDDEAPSPLPVVEASTSTLNLTEGGGAGSYTIQLKSDPGGSVTVNVVNPDAGAVSVSTTSVVFDSATWNSPRTITVTPVDDGNAADESVEIEHRTYNQTAGSITITVEDGDGEPGVIISPSRIYVDELRGVDLLTPGYEGRSLDYISEHGRQANLCFKLATDPEGTVRIHLPKNKSFGYWVRNGQNSFGRSEHTIGFTGGADGDWNEDHCVGVLTYRDPIKKNKSGTVTLSVTGYQGVSSAPLDWEIYDNAWARIEPSKTTINLDEGGSPATYDLRVMYQLDEVVTITVDNPDTSSIRVSPTKVTLDRNSPYRFGCSGAYYCVPMTVTPLRDSDFFGETIALRHSVKGFFHVTSTPAIIVKIKEPFGNGIHAFPTNLILLENTVGDNLHIRLGIDPGDKVKVVVKPSVASAYSAKLSFTPPTLTFTGGDDGNWGTYKTIAVTSNADTDTMDEEFTITLLYNGTTETLEAPEITVKIQDIGN